MAESRVTVVDLMVGGFIFFLGSLILFGVGVAAGRTLGQTVREITQ